MNLKILTGIQSLESKKKATEKMISMRKKTLDLTKRKRMMRTKMK